MNTTRTFLGLSPILALSLVALPAIAISQAKPAEEPPKISVPSQQEISIVGARIELGDGAVIEKGVVTIKGGLIISITSGDSAPSGTTVYKADGLTLYPGFIDGFTPEGLKTQPAWTDDNKPNTTTTAPPTMWIANRKGISPEWGAADNLDFKPSESLYKAGITTALIAPNRGSIRGAGAIVDSLAGENRVINPNVGLSMSFKAGSGAGYPGNILGLIALMRQTLADAVSLSNGAELVPPTDKKPAWMLSLEALKPVVTGKSPVLFEANTERELGRAFRLSDEFGFKLIFVGGREAYKIAPQLAETRTPVIFNVDIGDEPALTGSNTDTNPTPEAIRKERNDKWQEQSHCFEQLVKAGVPVAFGSLGYTSDYLKNVRKLIKRGLDRNVALKAMTVGPATLFGLQGNLGTISVGKKANLVLMSGDFADDKSEVTRVWVDGRPVFEKKSESTAKEVKK